jgi:hypothetical protein
MDVLAAARRNCAWFDGLGATTTVLRCRKRCCLVVTLIVSATQKILVSDGRHALADSRRLGGFRVETVKD